MTRMMNLNRHLEVARRRMTDGYLYVHACTLLRALGLFLIIPILVCGLHKMGVGLVGYRSK